MSQHIVNGTQISNLKILIISIYKLANLTPPYLFIELHVPSQEREWSCIFVLGLSFLHFSIRFWKCFYSVVICLFFTMQFTLNRHIHNIHRHIFVAVPIQTCFCGCPNRHVFVAVPIQTCFCACPNTHMFLCLFQYRHIFVPVPIYTYFCGCRNIDIFLCLSKYRHVFLAVPIQTCFCGCPNIDMFLHLS